jgi:hypothetical protein
MLQLNPPIPLQTPKGEGLATLVIDYGPDYDLLWTVIITKGDHAGEVWTYPNPQVRGIKNITFGRLPATPAIESAAAPRNGNKVVPEPIAPIRRGMSAADPLS